MKKKKVFIILLIMFIVIMILVMSNKIIILKKYCITKEEQIFYDEIIQNIEQSSLLQINTNYLNQSEYLVNNNIKIRNDFKNFQKLDIQEFENDFVKYILYDEEGNIQASFWFGNAEDYITNFLNDENLKNVTRQEKQKYLRQNNIYNDLELMEYLLKKKNLNSNIFTLNKDIKGKYITNYLTVSIFSKVTSFYQLEGTYTGYVIKGDDLTEVYILKNNKKYVFNFLKSDYFTDDYIKELLATIVIY